MSHIDLNSVNHYENFPVASVLLPPFARKPIQAVYAFARTADDIADEGGATAAERLAALAAFKRDLAQTAKGDPPATALWQNLSVAMQEFDLSEQYLADLLDAFSQDVVKTRYATYAELQDYARRSANPVGRLVLQVCKMHTAQNVERSDAICSALQFINFWQDVEVDWRKQRIYIPQEDLIRHGVSEGDIAAHRITPAFIALMQFQVQRSRELLMSGTPLGRDLPGRLGLEIRTTITGGATILRKIERCKFNVFTQRPTIKKWEWPLLLLKSF
jgi:squalene synthase HpnC